MARVRGGKTAANKAGTENRAGSASEPEKNTVGDPINEENGDGGIAGDKKHEFSVGDFVWAEVTSRSLWWPGQIYDPSDASELASKRKQNDQLLVVYFGDDSSAWCLQSQLAPFTERFAEMFQQSTSREFVDAVDKALEEISRRAGLKMICSCVSEENRVGLARPQAMNTGVRLGVLVPEGDIERLAIPKHEPAEVLEYVRRLSQASLIGDKLELFVLRSWLSAFYSYKRSLLASTTTRKRLRKKNNDGVEAEKEVSESESPTTAKKNEDSGVRVDSEAKGESEKNLGSRERKKSKYLTHPYTAVPQKRQPESNPDTITEVPMVDDPMAEAANVSPTILKSDAAKSKGIMSEGLHSVKEVLVEVQRAGADLTSFTSDSIERTMKFITDYRNTIYLQGSNHILYLSQLAKKRKSPASESRNEGNDQPRSKVTKLKEAPRAAAVSKGKGVDEKASPEDSPASAGTPKFGQKSSTASKRSIPKKPTGLEMTVNENSQIALIRQKIQECTGILKEYKGEVSYEEKASLTDAIMDLSQAVYALGVQT